MDDAANAARSKPEPVPLGLPRTIKELCAWRPRTRKLEATAYHEAAHAVAAVYLNLPFTEVTIIPDRDGEGAIALDPSLTRWMKANRTLRSPAIKDRWDRLQVLASAGPLAHLVYNRRCKWRGPSWKAGSHSDRERVSRFAMALHPNTEPAKASKAAEAYIDYVSARAADIVERHWPEIESVANGLLERQTLSSDEVNELVQRD